MKEIMEGIMSDGHHVHVVKYTSENPIAHVHILHGLAEHIGRYEEFASFLVSHGFSVSGHDHRGHGRTAEKNGQLGYYGDGEGFDRVVEDVREVLHLVYKEESLPLILLGHSMGSFVARRYMQKYSETLSKVILSGTMYSPGIMGDAGILLGKFQSKVHSPQTESPLLNSLAFGAFNKQVKNPETPFDWLPRDAEEVQKYIDDPLCGFIPTNKLYTDMFGGLKTIHKQQEIEKVRKDLPILLISGEVDPVGKNGKDVFKVAEGMKKAGMRNITVQLVEGARHEILKETNRQQTYEVMLNWMLK